MGSKGLNKPLLLWRMGITFYQRCLVALVLLGWGPFVLAEEYYWQCGQVQCTPQTTPKAAAEQSATAQNVNLSGWTFDACTLQRDDLAACNWKQPHPNNPNIFDNRGFYVNRYGNTCTGTFDPTTGICTPDKNECEAKIGQTHSFGTDMGQMEACIDKCIVVVDASSPDPITTYKKPGDISKTYWWVTGMFSGESCATSNDGDSSAPPPTESSSSNNCSPTTTAADGTQSSSCTETKTDVDNQGCVAAGGHVGSVNGVMRCVAGGKGPKASETTTTTKTDTKVNPDGSKSQTTTKTTEQKNCSGAGACSTNTTTNVNHNNTNADGTKGSESSTCSGANCTGSTGSGDGKGDGKGDGEGEGEEGEGPAGPQGTLQKGEQGSFAEGISEWDQRISEVRGELDQKLDQYSGMFKGVFDLNLSTGRGSLPCDNIPVSFGSTSTTLRFCLADYADPLSYLRYALLLGAAALAAIIILRG